MLKNDSSENLATKPLTARIGAAVPAKDVDPLATLTSADEQENRESAIRRRHRLRMKDFFSAAKSAS